MVTLTYNVHALFLMWSAVLSLQLKRMQEMLEKMQQQMHEKDQWYTHTQTHTAAVRCECI